VGYAVGDPPLRQDRYCSAPGTLPMEMQVPARLIEVLPKNWHMSLNMRVAEVQDGKIAPPDGSQARNVPGIGL